MTRGPCLVFSLLFILVVVGDTIICKLVPFAPVHRSGPSLIQISGWKISIFPEILWAD